MSQGIITFAFGGQRKYLDLAKNLAKTLKKTNPSIKRCLITDSEDEELNSLFDDIVDYRKDYGNSVEQKIFIDKYSPYKKTLFIDSDSLVVEDIEYMFNEFDSFNYPFVAVGDTYLKRGDCHPLFNVDHLINNLNLDALPCFNGGVYYFDKEKKPNDFFEFSRELLKRDDLFPDKFRGEGIADEAIYSAALGAFNYPLIDFKNKGMYTTINMVGKPLIKNKTLSFYKRNFITGENNLKSPSIIHFPGNQTETFLYYKMLINITGEEIKIPRYTCFKNENTMMSKIFRKLLKLRFLK